MSEQTQAEQVARLIELRAPFPPEAISQLPKGGTTLDYVSHAHATERLLEVDPFWTWEPVAFGEDGLPQLVYDKNGSPVGLWIRLTVCGVTRFGYGSCTANKGDAVKELIGDALRNAAMRFGVALDLWKKEPLSPQQNNGQSRPQSGYSAPPMRAAPQPDNGINVASDSQVKLINSLAERLWGKEASGELYNRLQGVEVHNLARGEASNLITELKKLEGLPQR